MKLTACTLLLSALLWAACSSGSGRIEADGRAGSDTSETVGADADGEAAGLDTGKDLPPDTGVDAAVDAPLPDAGKDLLADTGKDLLADTGVDDGVDAAADAPLSDAGMDLLADAGVDAAVDAGTDAGPDVGPAPACTALKEEWIEEICNAAGLVIFDGEKCIATCPGCCGCGEYCPFTFQSVEQCIAACVATDCELYVAAQADCSFTLASGVDPAACVEALCNETWCKADADCPLADALDLGSLCVTGNCVYCSNDGGCPMGQVCRAGRCVNPAKTCPAAPPCSDLGCHLVTPGEEPCPVCVCDSLYGLPCEYDYDCWIINMHPYQYCLYGRCADCRNDADCDFGRCLPPGICYETAPGVETLYGTWLIGWYGGMDHVSYVRFEPDGTLRRGAYGPDGPWADDFPNLPCWPGEDVDMPLVGTWEPEVTQSGFLVVRMSLNVTCDTGNGWSARFVVNVSDDGKTAQFDDVDSDWTYDAVRTGNVCTPDMSSCPVPGE